MRSSSLNTLLVQRVETALGVPLAQHTQLASIRGRTVHPPVSAVAIAALESSTANPDFAKNLQNSSNRAKLGGFGVRSATESDGSSTTQGLKPSAAQAPNAARGMVSNAPGLPAPARSAQMSLSHIGRILSPLLEQFPQGAGPLTSKQPLFIGAVLALRAQAATASMLSNIVKDSGKTSVVDAGFQQNTASIHNLNTPTVPNTPVLSSVLTGALMQVLRGQIVNSGLFYESHLLRQMQKTGGKIELFVDEPQAAIKHISPNEDEIDLTLRPLVRQQLDILSGQPIQWHGQIWPGAFMQWEINTEPSHLTYEPQGEGENNDADRNAQDSNVDPTWSSTLALTLPHLGEIAVRINIRGQQVKLSLAVDEKGLLLADHLQGMHKNLVNAGLDPQSITVSRQAKHDE